MKGVIRLRAAMTDRQRIRKRRIGRARSHRAPGPRGTTHRSVAIARDSCSVKWSARSLKTVLAATCCQDAQERKLGALTPHSNLTRKNCRKPLIKKVGGF